MAFCSGLTITLHELFACDVDWEMTGSMLSGLGSVATATGAILVISNTFPQWKKQKKEERKQAQAERILIATYNARDALTLIRHPFYPEFRSGWVNFDPEQDAANNRAKIAEIHLQRLATSLEAEDALKACEPYASALFEETLGREINKICAIFGKIRSHTKFYAEYDQHNPEWTEELLSVLRDETLGSGSNQTTQEIAASVRAIEAICQPILRQ